MDIIFRRPLIIAPPRLYWAVVSDPQRSDRSPRESWLEVRVECMQNFRTMPETYPSSKTAIRSKCDRISPVLPIPTPRHLHNVPSPHPAMYFGTSANDALLCQRLRVPRPCLSGRCRPNPFIRILSSCACRMDQTSPDHQQCWWKQQPEPRNREQQALLKLCGVEEAKQPYIIPPGYGIWRVIKTRRMNVVRSILLTSK